MSKNGYEKVFTIVFGDLHLGDEGFREDLWMSSVRKWINLIYDHNPDKIIIINIGDTVVGSNIYRNQEVESIVTKTTWQVSVATELMLELIEQIRSISRSPISMYIFMGNHDKTRTSNLAIELQKELRAWCKELNFNVYYKSFVATIDIGPKNQSFKLLCFHGRGSSKIYPVSPSAIRDVQNYLLQTGKSVDAIITGHNHWFSSIRFQWGKNNGIMWYTVGAYQTYNSEQRQQKFGVSNLPHGNWCFINGKEIPVVPKEKEIKCLEFKNYDVMGDYFKRYMKRLKESGFVE